MFGFKKQAGDPAILLTALEKLEKVLKPGNYDIDGMDVGKVVAEALKQFKG